MIPKRVFYDCEFIEGFSNGRHFIDLISIAMIKETGEKYFAVSKQYNYDDASEWVKENVLAPLYIKLDLAAINYINVTNFHQWAGKTYKQIAEEITSFIGGENIILYGYYADYDHVLLSSLFGRMVDLPKNFPMYTRDIQQIIDGFELDKKKIKEDVPQDNAHDCEFDAKWNMDAYFYIKGMIESNKKTKKNVKTI